MQMKERCSRYRLVPAALMLCMWITSCSRGSNVSNALAIARARQEVSLDAFGLAGTGKDDTAVFQKAILYAAANRKTLRIPASDTPYNVAPLNIPSHAHIGLDSGVVIQALPGYTE